MYYFHSYHLTFLLFFGTTLYFAQETSAINTGAESSFVVNDCGIIEPRRTTKTIPYVYTFPIHLRVNNKEIAYTTLEFSKRRKSVYLYMKILEENICIQQENVVELFFKSGNSILLSNDHPVNCEGNFVKKLTRQEIMLIESEEIASITVYSFRKNYEHYFNSTQSAVFHHLLNCISHYTIKK